ncbi:MAG: hypothetical protein HEEMFOPI_02027 [Holosporales bacterium]
MNDFKLSNDELYEIQTTRKKTNQLAFAILFKYFQKHQKFPNQNDSDFSKIVKNISNQLGINESINWTSSSIEKNKKGIFLVIEL